MKNQNLSQSAYILIKEKIISCEFAPNDMLNEDMLSTTLGMSRTPIRDALSRLEQSNLVKKLPKKGYIGSPVSIQEVNMVYEGRILIEPYVLLNYCQHLSPQIIKQMSDFLIAEEAEITDNDSNTYTSDNSFHLCIMNQCTNHYFLNLYTELHDQNHRLRILGGHVSKDRLIKTVEEHHKILLALTKNNCSEAANAMVLHLSNSKDFFFQSIMSKYTL